MADVRVAKESRTQIRRTVTNELKLRAAYDVVTEANLKQASVYLSKLKGFRFELASLDETMALSVSDDDNVLADEVDRARLYQAQLADAIHELEFNVASFHNQQHRAQAAQQSVPLPAVAAAQTPLQTRGVRHKALEVDVVKFNGDPAQWEEFYDDFLATVDKKPHYSNVEKLKILKASLAGEAQGVLKGFLLTDANYEQAKQALEERYANKQLRRFAHFEALLAVPHADHVTSSLWEMHDECEAHIRSLVALGMDEGKFGEVFIPILLSKLPKFVRMEVSRKNGTDEWTLPNLRKLLKNEIEYRDACDKTSWAEKDQKLKKRGQRKSGEPKSTASALVVESSAKGKGRQCAFCRKAHESHLCTTYADVVSRRAQIPEQCYSCLGSGHVSRRCPQKVACQFCARKGHHSSLCFAKYGSSVVGQTSTNSVQVVDCRNAEEDPLGESVNVVASDKRAGCAILETAVATVKGTRTEVKARLIFDTASTLSFIKTSVAKQIGAKLLGEEATSVGRFRDTKRSTSVYRLYEVDILVPGGCRRRIVVNAVDVISTPVRVVPIAAAHRSVLSSVSLAEPIVDVPKAVEVDVLVGLDCYHSFFEDAQIRLTDDLVLKKSVIGWIASGFQRSESSDLGDNVHVILRVAGQKAELFDVERFWALDEIGIKDDPGSVDDETALQFFNDTIRFEDGRYQVKWPFKYPNPNLPDNQKVAERRLKSLWSKFKDQPQTLAAYNQVIADQLSKKIIEVAPEVPDGLVHYLPHHGVVKESSSTTKLRVVYDASAKASRNSLSLNDCLFRGPILMNDLCGILVRARLHPIGILSDVEKAYLQVGLQIEDRDVTRFFWVNDVAKGLSDDNIVCYRFRRVLFGLRPSAFMLSGTLAVHLRQSERPVAKELEGNIYVDNAFQGKATVTEAIEFYREAKQLLSEASMNLREWFSNSDELIQAIPEKDRGKGDVTQLLGIKWHLTNDELSSQPKLKDVQQPVTKRSVLKTMAAVYDPCGWFCPVLMLGKFLMQDLWLRKGDWDAKLPEELIPTWDNIWNNIQGIPGVRISRCVDKMASSPDSLIELHTFCDASARAYAAATYIRVESSGVVTSSLLFAKGRISPAGKQLTIPRLELVSAVIGSRLQGFVGKELRLPVRRQVIWTDSKCLLHWLHSKTVQTTFVENRLREIRKSLDDMEFRYVPTSDNPADLPTRGMNIDSLKTSTLWWHGPAWLTKSEDNWPVSVGVAEKFNHAEYEAVMATVGDAIEPVIDINRFSSLTRLLRVTAWVLRFADRVNGLKPPDTSITAAELASAERFWVKRVQEKTLPGFFGREMSGKLQKEKRQLGLYADVEGIVRCKGRLEHAELSRDQKEPIYLSQDHPFTKLVIWRAHLRMFHGGVATTLAAVRSQFWVTRGRSLTKKVIRECPRCRRIDGGPFRVPNPPPLPPERVMEADPFGVTGVDYAGPLYVEVAGEPVKVWIALFTCAVVRAVHLEVAESLSASDFLLCFRRFVAARGAPRIMISDNAKQFRLSSNLFANDWAKAVTSKDVRKFCAESAIEWKFIPEMAPWMGGFYERMVKPVKDALKKTVGAKLISLKELTTLVSEIANVINNRPLTYLETDVGDRPLRPIDFLRTSARKLSTPSRDVSPGRRPIAQEVARQWEESQKQLESCWREFQSKYLLGLRQQYGQHTNRNCSDIVPKVGTVVLVKDSLPRLRWRIGRIMKLNESRDKVCRSAELRLGNRNIITRPIKLLYPLEYSAEVEGSEFEASKPRSAALRKCALVAKQRIRAQISEEQGYSSDDQ